jgi:hypothetical protein
MSDCLGKFEGNPLRGCLVENTKELSGLRPGYGDILLTHQEDLFNV